MLPRKGKHGIVLPVSLNGSLSICCSHEQSRCTIKSPCAASKHWLMPLEYSAEPVSTLFSLCSRVGSLLWDFVLNPKVFSTHTVYPNNAGSGQVNFTFMRWSPLVCFRKHKHALKELTFITPHGRVLSAFSPNPELATGFRTQRSQDFFEAGLYSAPKYLYGLLSFFPSVWYGVCNYQPSSGCATDLFTN